MMRATIVDIQPTNDETAALVSDNDREMEILHHDTAETSYVILYNE